MVSRSETEPLLGWKHRSVGSDEEFWSLEKKKAFLDGNRIGDDGSRKKMDSDFYTASGSTKQRVSGETRIWNGIGFFCSIRKLWQLMVVAKGHNAILLIFISIANLLVVAKSGMVAGMFYNALVDRNLPLFWSTLSHAIVWYGASSLCLSVKSWISDFLVMRWRIVLTERAHEAYFQKHVLYPLSVGFKYEIDGKKIFVDNPDQRIAQEIQNFCDRMAEFLSKTLMSPVLVIFYTFWVKSVVGWGCVSIIYLCFLVGAFACSYLVQFLSSSISLQEHLQANFRADHMRVKSNAEGISFYRSFDSEKQFLTADFNRVIKNQRKIVHQKFALAFMTNSYDYMGAGLMYVVLSFPIFGHAFSKEGDIDAGKISQLISNSSFAILQLIYSFSQIIDSAKTFSELMGYAERVLEMFQALNLIAGRSNFLNQNPSDRDYFEKFSKDVRKEHDLIFCGGSPTVKTMPQMVNFRDDPTSPSKVPNTSFSPFIPLSPDAHKKRMNVQIDPHKYKAPKESVTPELENVADEMTKNENYVQNHMLSPPKRLNIFPYNEFEYSVHKVSHDHKKKVRSTFHLSKDLEIITVMTCQRLFSDTFQSRILSKKSHAFADMDNNLNKFLQLVNFVYRILTERGYWVDGIDPCTGYPLSNRILSSYPSSDKDVHLLTNVIDDHNGGINDVNKDRTADVDDLYDTPCFDSNEDNEDKSTKKTLLASGSYLTMEMREKAMEKEKYDSRGKLISVKSEKLLREEVERYCEVYAASKLLGYKIKEDGICPLLIHPVFGECCYPASFFTNAPFPLLMVAISSFEEARNKKVSENIIDEALGSKEESEGRIENGNSIIELSEPGGEESEKIGQKNFDSIGEERLQMISKEDEEKRWMVLDKIHVSIPGTEKPVISNLSLVLEKSDRLLVMGNSGSGKSSLLRALANIWPITSGRIYSFGKDSSLAVHDEVWYIPQRPVISRGSFAAQILYPYLLSDAHTTDASKLQWGFNSELDFQTRNRMVWALQQVGLEKMVSRFDFNWQVELDWENVLSPGERQCLSLARVFFHLPKIKILFLDESTSAVSEETEELIYHNLTSLGLTVVSISHKKLLRKWHNRILRIEDDGKWELQDCTLCSSQVN